MTDVSFPPFCLGGNVFGWTADEDASFAVLDAARAAGIGFLDSADVYSAWAHGGVGGQSERIIGRWIASRGAREETVVATKVGMHPGLADIRPATVRRAAEASLARLEIDAIDLYYAHEDDGGDLVESLAAFDALVRHGLVRQVGLSNFSGSRLAEALEVCERENFTKPVAFQPKYSLMERGFEQDSQDQARGAGLAVLPYSSLASGFLTGKYRPDGPPVDSPRAGRAAEYLSQPRGRAVLAALDAVAAAHDVPVASAALAWVRAQPPVVAPIASARTVQQVDPLARSIGLTLSGEELVLLDDASRFGSTG